MSKQVDQARAQILEELAHNGGSCEVTHLFAVIQARGRLQSGKSFSDWTLRQSLKAMGEDGSLTQPFDFYGSRTVQMAGDAALIADYKDRRAAAVDKALAAGSERIRSRSRSLAEKLATVQLMIETVASDPRDLGAIAGLEHAFTQLSTEMTRVRRDTKALGHSWW